MLEIQGSKEASSKILMGNGIIVFYWIPEFYLLGF